MPSDVRTRFAPSPTGLLHIGNARTAIMNWIFARHAGGSFILRIEDTDRERSTRSSEASILDDLRWLGLDWDEGPDRNNGFGPYRQSERLDLYGRILQQLLDDGKAYPCYCSTAELEAQRKRLESGETVRLIDPCTTLTSDRKRQLEAEGRRPAYRFAVGAKTVSYDDLIRGPISFLGENIGDFIIARADRMPMYNFACVVDDHGMHVTHVIRGDDHVSNTPRQILLYHALSWQPPFFAHIPMILGKDRVRLSKRHGATSVSEYRKNGYLPEAVVNFLSLLSWSSESEEEILSRERLIREFDFGRVSKSASIFDMEKLDWMNGVYIRSVDVERLIPLARSFFNEAFGPIPDETIRTVLTLLHDRLEKLSQIAELAKPFFQERPVPENPLVESALKTPEARAVFRAFLDESTAALSWDADAFQSTMKSVQQKSGLKGKILWLPVRAALTGQLHGPDLAKTAELFGLEKCRRLINEALLRP
ncbi:MAG TPA: glutamate--tRNA ligase [bacterium]